jgi:hypothetical protein
MSYQGIVQTRLTQLFTNPLWAGLIRTGMYRRQRPATPETAAERLEIPVHVLLETRTNERIPGLLWQGTDRQVCLQQCELATLGMPQPNDALCIAGREHVVVAAWEEASGLLWSLQVRDA